MKINTGDIVWQWIDMKPDKCIKQIPVPFELPYLLLMKTSHCFFQNMSTFRTIKPVSFREGDKKRLIPRKTHLCNEEQKAMVLI